MGLNYQQGKSRIPTSTVRKSTPYKARTISSKFCYLGGTVANDYPIDKEIEERIAKGSGTFYSLKPKVWDCKGIFINTKLLVYNAAIVPTLFYGSETWTIYVRHIRKIENFNQRWLRQLF